MPLYEYECTACGQRLEVIQKFSDEALTTCNSCGGDLERVISAPAIKFKGEGWYVTDYARKAKADKSDKPDKSEKDSKKEESPKGGAADKSSSKGSG